ncbi:hypothetical protein B0H11DRAFT_2306925, partial [Mycena galericulata]
PFFLLARPSLPPISTLTPPSTLFLPRDSPSTPSMASPPPGMRSKDKRGYPLDPFFHLRHPLCESLLDLLMDREAMDDTRDTQLKGAVTSAMPFLGRLRYQFHNRDMPEDLKRLLYPLRRICRHLPDELSAELKLHRPPLIKAWPKYPLDPGWAMPPASDFYVAVTPLRTPSPAPPVTPTRSGSKTAASPPPKSSTPVASPKPKGKGRVIQSPSTPASKTPASKAREGAVAGPSSSSAVTPPKAAAPKSQDKARAGPSKRPAPFFTLARMQPTDNNLLDRRRRKFAPSGPPQHSRLTRANLAAHQKPASEAPLPVASGSKPALGESESPGDRSGDKASTPDSPARSPQRLTSIARAASTSAVGTPAPRAKSPVGKPSAGVIRVPPLKKKPSRIPAPSQGKMEVVLTSRPSTASSSRSRQRPASPPPAWHANGKRKVTTPLPSPRPTKRVTRSSNASSTKSVDARSNASPGPSKRPADTKPSKRGPSRTKPSTRDFRDDKRVSTSFLEDRGPKNKDGKQAPFGEPWYPPSTKTLFYNGVPTKDISRDHLPAAQAIVEPLPPLSKKQIVGSSVRLLIDPGYICTNCINGNAHCEFGGWGARCTACSNRKGCGFTQTDKQLEYNRQQAAPWFQMGNQHLLYMIDDMNNAYIRAENASHAAAAAAVKYENKFLAFAKQADVIIETIGVDAFRDRFENSGPDVIEHVERMIDNFNNGLDILAERSHPDHIASFDPSRAAHENKDRASPGPSVQYDVGDDDAEGSVEEEESMES